MTSPNPAIPSLTGLRFIAAFSIAFTHLTGAHNFLFGYYPVNLAPLGMPLFFTLSGFVIHYAHRTHQADGRWLYEFAVARVSRIYPLFLFFVAFFMLFSPPFRDPLIEHAGIGIAYALGLASWFFWTIDGKPITDMVFGLSWSVSSELFFYLAYAVGFWRISKIASLRTAVMSLAVLCAGAFFMCWMLWTTAPLWSVNTVDPFYRWVIYVSPYVHLPEFMGGVLTCQIYFLMQRSPAAAARLTRAGVVTIGVSLGLLYTAWYFRPALPQSLLPLFDYISFLHNSFLLAPGCYLLILGLANGDSATSRVLSGKGIVFLGACSYSIYLGQTLAGNLVFVPVGENLVALRYAFQMICLFVLSSGLYMIVEMPSQHFLRELFTRRIRSPKMRTSSTLPQRSTQL